ncbi:VCBS repeat-containing protein, partial [Patescibacteria group bacterium]|nr:VCBS repeat-containing protein [Patescibacteria group bacterium]
FAYDSHIRSGVKVTTGDLNGDGIDEIITGTGSGGGPHIRIFTKEGNLYNSGFFAYDKSFRGGVNVASGDLDGDGIDEIIAGAGNGGGPHIRVFDGAGNPKLTNGFFAYDSKFRGGVNVATGDIDADGEAEIIAGAGQGGGPQIRVFEGNGTLKPIQFFAFHPDNRSGISVASADFDNDGKDEIVAGQLTNEETWVKVYRYNNSKTVLANFRAYGQGVETGVNVAAADIDNDNIAEIITGPNYGGGPQVRTFKLDSTPINSFFAYTTSFRGGTYVAVGDFE